MQHELQGRWSSCLESKRYTVQLTPIYKSRSDQTVRFVCLLECQRASDASANSFCLSRSMRTGSSLKRFATVLLGIQTNFDFSVFPSKRCSSYVSTNSKFSRALYRTLQRFPSRRLLKEADALVDFCHGLLMLQHPPLLLSDRLAGLASDRR